MPSLIYFTLNLVSQTSLLLSMNNFLLVIGAMSVAFNLSMQTAFKTAPNIGYVSAINVSSIMSITLFSGLIFKDELSKRKVLGMLGVMISLVWLLF